MTFDPWTATDEELDEIQKNESAPYSVEKLYLCFDARYILERKEQIEAGNGEVLLECVAIILKTGLKAPWWLHSAFRKCRTEVISGQRLSWDDVFGRPHPEMTSQKRLDARRRDADISQKLGRYVERDKRENPRKTMTMRLGEAADLYGLTPEKAQRLYKNFRESRTIRLRLSDYQQKRLTSSMKMKNSQNGEIVNDDFKLKITLSMK